MFTTEGDYLDLAEACRERGATTLVLGSAPSTHPFVIDAAEELHRDGVRVRSLDDFYDESIGKLPLSSLDRFALMGDIESLHGAYAPLKRTIDIVLAALGSLLCLVLAPFVLIGNLIAQPGSDLLPTGAGRPQRQAVPDLEVAHDGTRRGRRLGLDVGGRSPDHAASARCCVERTSTSCPR